MALILSIAMNGFGTVRFTSPYKWNDDLEINTLNGNIHISSKQEELFNIQIIGANQEIYYNQIIPLSFFTEWMISTYEFPVGTYLLVISNEKGESYCITFVKNVSF